MPILQVTILYLGLFTLPSQRILKLTQQISHKLISIQAATTYITEVTTY
jgi:hypothetical protein